MEKKFYTCQPRGLSRFTHTIRNNAMRFTGANPSSYRYNYYFFIIIVEALTIAHFLCLSLLAYAGNGK